MPEYDNTNKGALFRNNRRERDSQPEFNGSLNVAGKEYFISAWVKEGKSGSKFFSLSVQPKDGASNGKAPAKKSPVYDDDPEPIPF